MYIFIIVLIILASLLLVLAVLAQHPKGGMAANFGASNQVMGVRQTSDFLEKFTWGCAIVIVCLSIVATHFMTPSGALDQSRIQENLELNITEEINTFPVPTATTVPAEEAPAATDAQPAE